MDQLRTDMDQLAAPTCSSDSYELCHVYFSCCEAYTLAQSLRRSLHHPYKTAKVAYVGSSPLRGRGPTRLAVALFILNETRGTKG